MTFNSSFTALRFQNKIGAEFTSVLNKRVNDYFKTTKTGRYANGAMVFKSVFMILLFAVPYTLLLSGVFTSSWMFLLMWILMGLGMAGIGLSVMHDANHGAYSRSKTVNRIIGYSLNLIGGNATNWKIQHNVKHHTYTNIDGHDEDIAPKGGILRFSPHSRLRKIHRYQYIYAWLFYGLMTFTWILFKDIKQMIEYTRDGLLKKQTRVGRAWIVLIMTKVMYVSYIFVIPVVFTPFAFWQVFLGFFVMHYVAGFILGVVFQPAHVLEGTEFPLPDEQGNMKGNWTVHQLLTTSNYAHKNRLLSWYVGGLNYQVEHHLFPNVCHIHYRKISKIVSSTAREYGIPYNSYDTFRSALLSHGRLLYSLGR